jgi:outer membrane receptor protein involved in Fe transport
MGAQLRWTRAIAICGAALCSLLAASAARAADGADAATLGELVVTAQKRSDRLSEVPAAVSALSAERLQANGELTIRDITATLPGVQVANGFGSGAFTMRGLTAGNDVNSTVGVQIDGAPIGPAAFGAAAASVLPEIDPSLIARIEVLRGPQGTLYGSSTLGGIVNYVTASPSLSEAGGSLYAEGAFTRHGDASAVVRGTFETPIVYDRIGLSVSGFVNRLGGYIDAPLAGKEDYNHHRSAGGRVALRAQVTPEVDVEISDIHTRLNSNADFATFNAATQRPVAGSLAYNEVVLPKYRNEANIFLAKANYARPWGTISYVASAQSLDTGVIADFGQAGIAGILTGVAPAFGGVALPSRANLGVDSSLTSQKVTQELRIASPDHGPLKWTAGLFYSDEDSKQPQFISSYGDGGPRPAPLANLIRYDLLTHYQELAAFGNLTYAITDKLDVTGGMRVQRIKQDYRQLYSGTDAVALNGVFQAFGFLPTPSDSGVSKAEDTVKTYLANVRYRVSADNMVYFRYATGFRPGGPNIILPGLPATFGPDTTEDYEVGWKSTILDGRGFLAVDAYQVTWKDMQVLTLVSGINGQINGGRARSQGVEVSGSVKPVSGLSLSGTLAYSRAHLLEDLPTGLGRKGDTMPMNPTWSGSLSGEYEWTVAGDWRAFAGASGRYVGERLFTFASNAVYAQYVLPSYAAFDLRAGLRHERMEFAAFVRNAGDERGQLGALTLSGTQVVMQRPLTVGASVGARF